MFWLKWISLFDGDKVVAILALSLSATLFISAAVGFLFHNLGLYGAFAFLFVGGGCMACLLYKCSWQALMMLFAVLVGIGGILYAALFLALTLRSRGLERKALRRELQRRVEYTLPHSGNTYLRARLHTALHGELKEEAQEVEVSLGYARRMLVLVRAAALSPVERLDVEEMARLISVYSCQLRWTGADMRAVNEIFARLLKLSAKYEIAV